MSRLHARPYGAVGPRKSSSGRAGGPGSGVSATASCHCPAAHVVTAPAKATTARDANQLLLQPTRPGHLDRSRIASEGEPNQSSSIPILRAREESQMEIDFLVWRKDSSLA